MSHQDNGSQQVRYNAEFLQQALCWLLSSGNWSSLKFRDDCTWLPRQLVAAALVWAWSDEQTLGERFFAARRIIDFVDRPQRNFASSVQAFMKLLARWTRELAAVLQVAFRQRMRATLAQRWLVHGFAVFGMDGSRVELPRTRSHEAAYAPQSKVKLRNGRRRRASAAAVKKAQTPLIWLTLLWHVGTGLPWCWRCGPSGSSEREHCLAMLEELPAGALLTGDAGFTGYNFLQTILHSGRHVLVRMGSNVRLLRKLGWKGESQNTVYLWPEHVATASQPPLVLRLIILRGPQQPLYLVTSVPASRLNERQVIDIYRRRWGIELFFRHFKQTFQRRKLRSASAEPALIELHWSLLGLWGMALYAQVELERQDLDSAQLSIAHVLRSFRRILRDYRHPAERDCSLNSLLHRAVRDTYRRRNKASRNYPRKKHPDPPARPPRIRSATAHQIKQAHLLRRAA